MKKLLPQANSLETVIRVFIYVDTLGSSSVDDIAKFIGFEPRQASYYLNACYYLDLVDSDGQVTDFGHDIASDPVNLENRIYERIITDSLIGKIFAHMLLFPKEPELDYAKDIVYEQYGSQYGDAVIARRASTLVSWCKEVLSHL